MQYIIWTRFPANNGFNLSEGSPSAADFETRSSGVTAMNKRFIDWSSKAASRLNIAFTNRYAKSRPGAAEYTSLKYRVLLACLMVSVMLFRVRLNFVLILVPVRRSKLDFNQPRSSSRYIIRHAPFWRDRRPAGKLASVSYLWRRAVRLGCISKYKAGRWMSAGGWYGESGSVYGILIPVRSSR